MVFVFLLNVSQHKMGFFNAPPHPPFFVLHFNTPKAYGILVDFPQDLFYCLT